MGIPGAVGAGAAIDTDSSIRMGATGPKLTAEVIIILRIIKRTLCQHAHRYTAIPLYKGMWNLKGGTIHNTLALMVWPFG